MKKKNNCFGNLTLFSPCFLMSDDSSCDPVKKKVTPARLYLAYYRGAAGVMLRKQYCFKPLFKIHCKRMFVGSVRQGGKSNCKVESYCVYIFCSEIPAGLGFSLNSVFLYHVVQLITFVFRTKAATVYWNYESFFFHTSTI